jgi:hypothetical protein
MCLFSGPVEKVWSTRIFARPLENGRQLLVYGMSVEVADDVAMILPVPVPAGSPDDAVTFVDLSSRPAFFEDVAALFPPPEREALALGRSLVAGPQPQSLVVHEVGDFEASFVPRPRDFDRLDERFRLPGDVFDAIPKYADWGFCVFKLRGPGGGRSSILDLFRSKSRRGGAGKSRAIHPMAFEFPRRDPSALFFPTVHVHDGAVHPTAEFDHALYCQTDAALEPFMQWERSASRAQAMPEDAQRWVEPARFVYKRTLSGEQPNRDTLVTETKLRARAAVGEMFRVRMRAAWEHVIDDGKTPLDARTKKWMRVSEAERVRIREAVFAELSKVLAQNAESWSLGPFAHDAPFETFEAWNERIEPQLVDVAFRGPPTAEALVQIRRSVKAAFDRATG